MDTCFDIGVTSEYGNVVICTKIGDRQVGKLKNKARALERELEGINHLEIHAGVHFPENAV